MYETDFLDGAYGPGGNLLILGTASSSNQASTVFEAGQSTCGPAGTDTSPCIGFYRRTDHTVWYTSPDFSGFSFEVDYTLSPYKTADNDPRVISIGGKYAPEGMPFRIDAAYEEHRDFYGMNALAGQGGGNSSKDTGLQFGGTFMFGDFTVGARYEMLEYKTSGALAGPITSWERDAFFINGKMNLPTGYAALQIGIANDADTNLGKQNDTGATMIGLGYMHNLSRQSQLQVIYNQMDNDAAAQYIAIGGTNVAPGVDHKGIYLGIKHTF